MYSTRLIISLTDDLLMSYFTPYRICTKRFFGTDNQEKDEKQSQNDKTGLGMEKTVKDKAKSKPKSSSQKSTEKSTGQSQSQPSHPGQ
ncbi:hypothetical protein Tco_1335137 [Tanacetum coccineum]